MLKGSGATRLFQVGGITVFMHWSWLLVAVFQIAGRTGAYTSIAWNVLEYLALFGIVTLHEFGHSFACRSVGGKADEILLWPFGGIAIIDAPPRPGAALWSIAAGPLVNVALAPILGGLALLISAEVSPNLHAFLRSVTFINVALLVFNLLPIYPLDGGQILGALLWFVVGRQRSMMVTAIIGLAGAVAIGLLALTSLSVWLGLIALLAASQCRLSIAHARVLRRMAGGPRRAGVACPSCQRTAPIGPYWRCDSCNAAFDVFDPAAGVAPEPSLLTTLHLSAAMSSAVTATVGPDQLHCPACYAEAATARCFDCGTVAPVADWSPTSDSSSCSSDIPVVTRFRPPRVPSVRLVVLSVCAAIGALMGVFVAIVLYTDSSRQAEAGAALFARYLALVVFALSFVPGIASTLLFARYRRTQKAFKLEMQRFQVAQPGRSW